MIIGNGLLASAFAKYDAKEVLIFASGVSNSSETNLIAFERERLLIDNTLSSYPNKLFVYFSTCSIYDSSKYDSPYVLHKLHMEEIIKQKAKNFLILRVSNAVGKGGNPRLLMNYLYKEFKQNNELIIHADATRNLIDVEDIVKLTNIIINDYQKNKIYNLAYLYNFKIIEIVKTFEKLFGFEAKKKIINCGENYSIDISLIENYFEITDKNKYLLQLLTKYYF